MVFPLQSKLSLIEIVVTVLLGGMATLGSTLQAVKKIEQYENNIFGNKGQGTYLHIHAAVKTGSVPNPPYPALSTWEAEPEAVPDVCLFKLFSCFPEAIFCEKNW